MRVLALVPLAALAGLALSVMSCASDGSGDHDDGWVDEDPDGAFDAPGRPRNFIEIDETHSSPAFRAYVNAALHVLAADDRDLPQLTWQSVKSGKVRIDEVADVTCTDFERIRVDNPEAMLSAGDWLHLHDPDSAPLLRLTDSIYGYQWSNRIYITHGQSAKTLASTIIHETNHVVNHSELHYYDDLPTSGFIEEYRAFTAERRFAPDRWAGVNMIDYVCDNYDWDRTKVNAMVIAAPLTPEQLPTAAAWARRRVDDDDAAAEDEGDCIARAQTDDAQHHSASR